MKRQENSTTTYHNTEPAFYEAEFFVALSFKIILLVFGIFFVALGIYIFQRKSFVFPLAIIVGGIALLYFAFKAFLDKEPRLKIGEVGLWTRKLGYKPWNNVRMTQMISKPGRPPQNYLEIYLFTGHQNYADDKVNISNLEDKDKIQPLILKLYRK